MRFEALDAWRGICALIVAVEHLSITNVLHANEFVRHGARFVDFFFVLSGFVIAHAYRERLARGVAEARRFLWRRVGRLWPLHIAILLALIGAEVAILIAGKAGISIGREAFTD
ncbi:MAG: acyltransferase, partial [Kofleriaceae bacterium]